MGEIECQFAMVSLVIVTHVAHAFHVDDDFGGTLRFPSGHRLVGKREDIRGFVMLEKLPIEAMNPPVVNQNNRQVVKRGLR